MLISEIATDHYSKTHLSMPTIVECQNWEDPVPTSSLNDLLTGQAFSDTTEIGPSIPQRWLVPLPEVSTETEACLGLLTDKEKERADRFRHEGARQQFIVGHGVIHLLLKQYLKDQYRSILWMESEHHKPFIRLPDASKPLEYNLSHCEGFIAVAMGKHSQGIDIEKIRKLDDLEGISRQVFTESELERVFETNDLETQHQTFFKFWTCKEAALKADGTGFMKDPKSLELRFVSAAPSSHQPVNWSDSIPSYSVAWTERF